MSFFPSSFLAPTGSHSTSFHPLFRLLDDFEQHSRNSEGHHRTAMKSFTPKFDVQELPETYELHGELPGIEQKNVEIEFTDPQTILIRGRTERSYTSGTPPAGTIEGAAAPTTITEGEANNKAHKASVEDEDGAVVSPQAPSNATTDVAAKGASEEQSDGPETKYWVSERSIGEFSRSFSFPVRVDHDTVTASMKNGVLTIVVPKAKKQEARKIAIS